MYQPTHNDVQARPGADACYLPEAWRVRELQKQEGKEACFRTGKACSGEDACEWRLHCKPVAEWLRYR